VKTPVETAADHSLVDLLRHLAAQGYHFVTPTPATHARVVARPDRSLGTCVEDVLGWSLPFQDGAIGGDIVDLLRAAGVLVREGDRWRSTVRVSSLHRDLFVHSAYPTLAEDSVFFGPDSYRFADLIAAELDRVPLRDGGRILDIGGGSGVGAIVAAHRCGACEVFLTDINAAALRLAAVNAAAAGVDITMTEGSGLGDVPGLFDLVTINPPYIIDEAGRAYRDGGGMHGGQLSLDLASEAAGRLAPGGRVLLYTGSAIIGGRDPLCEALREKAEALGLHLSYREIDPDVFGEELEEPAYADIDRIALVAAILSRAEAR
jgi:methylase of polypeptide subunit release factors